MCVWHTHVASRRLSIIFFLFFFQNKKKGLMKHFTRTGAGREFREINACQQRLFHTLSSWHINKIKIHSTFISCTTTHSLSLSPKLCVCESSFTPSCRVTPCVCARVVIQLSSSEGGKLNVQAEDINAKEKNNFFFFLTNKKKTFINCQKGFLIYNKR